MMKKTTAQLKKQLDKVFSLWIRLRDTKDGYGRCYTCKKLIHYKRGNAGHFIPRQYLATRWSPENVKLQCVGCNIYGNGQLLDFEENLIKEIGKERVEALKAKRHEIVILGRPWYEEKIEHYKTFITTL